MGSLTFWNPESASWMTSADMSPINKHCIVVGAGIVGASCAWHLVRRGARVTLVDPEMPGQSTSFGNCGMI